MHGYYTCFALCSSIKRCLEWICISYGHLHVQDFLMIIYTVVCFGDQLTVEHIRSAKAIRMNSEDGLHQLQGFLPAISD